MTDRTPLVAALLRTTARGPVPEPLAVRLCRAAVDLLQAPGGSFTWDPADALRLTACTTDELARLLDGVEELLGVGPGVRAVLDDRPATVVVTGPGAPRPAGPVPSAARGPGWLPLYATAVSRRLPAERLPLAVRAWPVRCAGAPVGALTVHGPPCDAVPRPRPGQDPPPDGQRVADALGAVLAVAPAGTPVRSPLHRAVGMVVAQTGRSPADALALLRARAWAAGSTLGAVAADVLERRLRFTPSASDGTAQPL